MGTVARLNEQCNKILYHSWDCEQMKYPDVAFQNGIAASLCVLVGGGLFFCLGMPFSSYAVVEVSCYDIIKLLTWLKLIEYFWGKWWEY